MDNRAFKADKLDQTLFVLIDQTRETNHQAVGLELEQLNIHVSEGRVLFIMSKEKGPLTINEISHWTLRNLNSVLVLINNMEKKGLVKKSKTKASRRAQISLTEKGRELVNNIPEKSINMLFSSLTHQEKILLEGMLKKIRSRGMELLGYNFKPPFLPQ
jgi:MarR family transcriptional regulator, 2-MHQ and catechol-resistance regulon repressor